MLTLRNLFILSFILISNACISQDYERVDATILLYPTRCDSPEELSKFISRDFSSDEEKVRAIYSWIIQNVSYDPNEYKKFDYRFSNIRERNKKEEITRNKIITRTLQKGVAVCEGYSFLFEKLCELQGITNYLVRGNTKTTLESIGGKFDANHLWNVAYIEGEPYLFDPTWGAGKFQGKFIKEPTYFYYKTPPQIFIKTHYPNLFEDALISNSINKQEFLNLPLIIEKDLLISDIETPKNGIIYTEMYFDEIQFSIKNLIPNSISYSYGTEIIPLENLDMSTNHIEFSVPIQLGVNTLMIYFDNQPAIGYKIK